MANVNTIKTRILNKYDLLTNYTGFTPLKGEVCVAVIGEEATTNKGLKGDVSKKPIVGIKVGDGSTSFENLPWIQAVAGDVSTFVKGIVDEAKFNELVNALITNAKLASAADLEALEVRVATNEGDITDLKAAVNTGANSLSNLRAAINAAVGTESDTKDSASIVGAKKYADAVAATAKSEAITAAGTAADAKYELIGVAEDKVKALAEGQVATNKGNIEALQTAVGDVSKFTGDDVSSAIKALQDSVGDSSEGLGAEVSALKDRMDDAEDRLDGHDDKIADLEAAIADNGDFGKRVVALEGEMDTAQEDISGLKETVNAHSTTLGTLIGTVEGDSGKSIRDIAALVISEALVGGGDDFDTLQEIAAWIKDHPADAAAMNEAIQSVKANLGYTTDAEGKEVVPATVDTRIANAIAALEIGTYAKAADLEQTNDDVDALTVRVKAIEDAPYATTGNVATAKSEVIGASTDASTADTIYGAKKHAEEKAATAKSEAISEAATAAAGLYEEKGVAAGLVLT